MTEMVAVRDGVRLATYSSGTPGDIPPVVLLHGGPGLWDYLSPVAAMLDDLTFVHRYDQRGCGASESGGELSMASFVCDLDDLRRAWGIDRWTVIGHSFGATLGLAYAATHPEHTAALGYLSGVGVGDWHSAFQNGELRRTARAARAIPGYGTRLAVAAEGRETSMDAEREWRRLAWATDYFDVARGYEQVAAMADAPYRINWQVNHAVDFTDHDTRAWAASVGCPVTIIHGDADPRPWRFAHDLAALIPQARWELLPQAGHMAWDEAPDITRHLLRELATQAR